MTPKPRSIRFWAIGRPILPRPITPTLSMTKLYAVWWSRGKGSGDETACTFGLRGGAEVEGLRLGRERGDRGHGRGHGLVGLLEPEPGEVDGAGGTEQRAEQHDLGLLGDVEHDRGLRPVGGPAQRPVLHVVELQHATVVPVDPHPEPGPAGDPGGPEHGAEADSVTQIAGRSDGLHERAEAGGFGDGGL